MSSLNEGRIRPVVENVYNDLLVRVVFWRFKIPSQRQFVPLQKDVFRSKTVHGFSKMDEVVQITSFPYERSSCLAQ